MVKNPPANERDIRDCGFDPCFGKIVNKGPSSQGYGFSLDMYGCESWTIKKAES